MKITHKKNALHVFKPEGLNTFYYLFKEYEVHYNEQRPKTTQVWHHHEHIHESIFIIEGQLTAEWKIGKNLKKQIVKSGDIIETENTPHTFINHTSKIVKFLVIKQLLLGKDKRKLLKNDKVLD